MLAMIWLEIVEKGYNELCDNIYRSSLPYKADSLNIPAHAEAWFPLIF